MIGLLTIFLTMGCTDKDGGTTITDGGLGGAELSPSEDQLRIDIYPSVGPEGLLKQTWIADVADGLEGITIMLEPTIVVSGEVVGYRTNPLNSEVPGEDRAPIAATVRLERPGTITGTATETTEDGSFELEVPAAKGYTVSIIPEDGQRLPFTVSMDNNLSSNTDLEIVDLGYGLPVYGHIRTQDGAGLQSLIVRLKDQASGVVGPASVTDSTGHYLLRAEPGLYTLEVEGQQGSAVPRFGTEAKVTEGEGLELDIDVGEILPSVVSGQITGEGEAGALRDIKVRLSSRSLRGTFGALDIETETDGDGLFGRQILAGEWVASFIPPYDSVFGGVDQYFDAQPGTEFIDIGDVILPRRVLFEGFLIDPTGSPLPNAAINAQEDGFDGYIFSATTDDDGGFAFEVPEGTMTLTASPADRSLAVTKWSIDSSRSGQTFQVIEGEEMSGVVQGPTGPVSFALIEARTMSGELLATTLSDETGEFTVNLSPL